jgi:methionyl-tRNA synthetase
MSREKFYLTTPIFYPNGKPHIGHAYNVIATDVLARFQRLDGKDVFSPARTSTGQKMQQNAQAEAKRQRNWPTATRRSSPDGRCMLGASA